MRISYNIYSSYRFIGFCIIFNDGDLIQGDLVLFETNSPENNKDAQLPNKTKGYPLSTGDLHIIRDLMQTAIPSIRTSGIMYSAKNNLISHII